MTTALITGATSGIGAAFAKAFAAQKYDLIITGRRKEKIQAVAEELKAKYSVDVEVIIAELANAKDLEALAAKIKTIKNLEILVNNAGFASRGYFYEVDFTSHETMLKVHTLATIKLTHAVLPTMVKNKRGAIINVSSIAAFYPYPQNAMYAATKAFLNRFTEAIKVELKGTGVRVQALCPGQTITDFHVRMGEGHEQAYKSRGLFKAMLPEKIVAVSLKCLRKNKVICVPGFNNKIIRILCFIRRLFL